MPLLFLSHAGADLARALALADAIEAGPEAKKAGLEVWVDQRPQGANRLIGGTPWQELLETARARLPHELIEEESPSAPGNGTRSYTSRPPP
jgi:hypothetical protein